MSGNLLLVGSIYSAALNRKHWPQVAKVMSRAPGRLALSIYKLQYLKFSFALNFSTKKKLKVSGQGMNFELLIRAGRTQ